MKVQTGKCTTHRHEILVKKDKICFSVKPVTECSTLCKAHSVTDKKVSFVCMPNGRIADLYVEKVMQGKTLTTELNKLSKSLDVTMTLPKTCVPVNRSL